MPQRNVRRFLRSMQMKMRKKRNRARRKMRIRLRSKTNYIRKVKKNRRKLMHNRK